MAIIAAVLLQLAPIFVPQPPADQQEPVRQCFTARITGYNRLDPAMNSRTFDGTPITTPEPIVAASRDIPLQTIVEIDGLGTFRVADRGSGLHPTHFDVATWSDAEAYQITSTRRVCVQEEP